MTRRRRAAAAASASGGGAGVCSRWRLVCAISVTCGPLDERTQFEHRVALGDRHELRSGRLARKRKIALDGRCKAVEVGLQQLGTLGQPNLAHRELLAPT